jgi:hypothetical protein
MIRHRRMKNKCYTTFLKGYVNDVLPASNKL